MTLPELAVSIVILGITAGGLLGAIGMSHRIARHITNRSAVLNAIQLQMEGIRGELRTGGYLGVAAASHPDEAVTLTSGPSGDLVATVQTSIRAMGLDQGTGALTDVGFGDVNRILFLEVVCSATWDLLGSEFTESETLTAYMTLL
jgi:type II secretory pathway pseudopilin PulG